MKRLVLLFALLLPVTADAGGISLRTTLTPKELQVTILHSLEADTYQMNAMMVSEELTRITSFFLERASSIQHRVIWRRPPEGTYWIEVTVMDRQGKVVQSGHTKFFVPPSL